MLGEGGQFKLSNYFHLFRRYFNERNDYFAVTVSLAGLVEVWRYLPDGTWVSEPDTPDSPPLYREPTDDELVDIITEPTHPCIACVVRDVPWTWHYTHSAGSCPCAPTSRCSPGG